MTTTQDQYLLPWDKNRQDWEAKHAERMGVIAKEDAKALADKEVLGKNIAAMREVQFHVQLLVEYMTALFLFLFLRIYAAFRKLHKTN